MESIDNASSCNGDHNVEKERDNIERTLKNTTEVGWKTFIAFIIWI